MSQIHYLITPESKYDFDKALFNYIFFFLLLYHQQQQQKKKNNVTSIEEMRCNSLKYDNE